MPGRCWRTARSRPRPGRVVIPRRPEDADAITDDLVHRLEIDERSGRGPAGRRRQRHRRAAAGRGGRRDRAGGSRRARPGAVRGQQRGPDGRRRARSSTGSSSARAGGCTAASGSPGPTAGPTARGSRSGSRMTWTIRTAIRPCGRSPATPGGSGALPRTLAVRATDDLATLLRGPHPGRVLGVRPARGERGEPRVRGDLVLRLDAVPRSLGDDLRRRLRRRGATLPPGLRPARRGRPRGRPAYRVRGLCRSRGGSPRSANA